MLTRQQTRKGLRGLAQQQIADALTGAHPELFGGKLPRKVRREMSKRIMKETIRRLNVHQSR